MNCHGVKAAPQPTKHPVQKQHSGLQKNQKTSLTFGYNFFNLSHLSIYEQVCLRLVYKASAILAVSIHECPLPDSSDVEHLVPHFLSSPILKHCMGVYHDNMV
jgi:hypothetical protein